MNTSRERVLQALCELVRLKDASVFQNADIFENRLKQLAGSDYHPEIAALKAGLRERIPWELQKGSSGPVAAALVNSLATNISRKHKTEPEITVWAVRSWAVSLNLSIEEAVADQPAKPAEKNAAPAVGAAVPVMTAWPVNDKNRLGVIFGIDAQGLVTVFKSWWHPAPESESASLAAVAVKREKTAIALFAAAPAPRKEKRAVAAPVVAAVSQTQPVKPAVSSPEPVVARKVASTQTPGPEPKSEPLVLTGSAEELCARAKSLLPGYGTRVDASAALQMLQQAAKLGSVPARRMIGEIYHKGLGVKQDFATAANWFKLAAESGDAHAQFYLGTLYQCGMGVEFNLPRAQVWLQKAADQGHKEAKTLLNEILQAQL